LYYVGTKQVATYVLTTSQGLILLDSGYRGKEEKVLLPGLKKLGLDPADIKIAIITHGHADHFGGARYLQDHYGTHIYLSTKDWDFIQPRPGKAPGEQADALPKRDMIAEEGQPITLADETITPVFIPGHTPGSLALIFPVKDKGKVHMAALFGGTILNPARQFPVSMWQQYLMSINHFREMTAAAKVDVELENHPIMDGTFDKMGKLREEQKGPNPFIVGRTAFQRWADVLSSCAQAQLDRAEARQPNQESGGF
jgi:metallo-beta-lactamase class B